MEPQGVLRRAVNSILMVALVSTALYGVTTVKANVDTGCCGNTSCEVLDGGYYVCSEGYTGLCKTNFPTCCVIGSELCCGEFGCDDNRD
jgi:hypothetical protein